MKRVGYIIAGVLAIGIGAALHYFLPQVDVVRLVGTDVKRMDTSDSASGAGSGNGTRTRDVYFILAEEPGGSPSNYRNEDAFFYLKYDSSDLHTQARSIAQNEEDLVAIRHYGWRIPFLSMFPNATQIWKVDSPSYSHFPLFNTIFLTLLAGGVGYVTFRIRKLRSRFGDNDEADEHISDSASPGSESQTDDPAYDQHKRDSERSYEEFFSEDQRVGKKNGGSSKRDD